MRNGVMFQSFEWHSLDDGQFYNHLAKDAAHLAAIGITGIWMPPASKGTSVYDVGYGSYDYFDLGEFDQKGTVRTKYGTKDELTRCIKALKDNNIEVYADVVLNHKGSADKKELFKAVKVNPDNRNEEIDEPRDIKGWTGFTFPGRKGNYSEFKWHYYHFTAVDYDDITKESAIYKIIGDFKEWSEGVSDEKGNFDYLMFADIDHAHPDVQKELYHYVEWLIDTLQLDGLRYDALKHIDDGFINGLSEYLKDKYGRDFFFIGEYWASDDKKMDSYLDDTDYNVHLFDVPLHFRLQRASLDGKNYDMRKIFDHTVVQEHPALSVTFVDNHDSQPNQSLESFVQPWFKPIAYGLILLRKDGYPCVFAGDYYGIGGEHPIEGNQETIENLLWIRQNYAYGEQVDYMADPQLIGWVRKGDHDHPGSLAVVISTGDVNTLTMNVGSDQAGKIYIDLTQKNTDEILIDENGDGHFTVGPGTITCWSEKREE